MNIRRVVTGFDEQGKSVFASDSAVEPLELDALAGWKFYDMWGEDDVPSLPRPGDKPPMATYFPPTTGHRFSFSVIPPEGTAAPEGIDEDRAQAEVEAALPGLMAHLEPDGMHTTDTIDFEIVLRGEVYLQLDDGVETLLRPGDTVVQNGTRHVWRNAGSEPVLLAVFMVGARREQS
ncbi:MAG TPA: cupin domain-containing protein [Egibacteraceae bacterium]|nr:cupin domain-containing protein [Egibacteraceae bacterium]